MSSIKKPKHRIARSSPNGFHGGFPAMLDQSKIETKFALQMEAMQSLAQGLAHLNTGLKEAMKRIEILERDNKSNDVS